MSTRKKKLIYIFLGLFIPLLSSQNFSLISLAGVYPYWAILWLLPWSLKEGALSGLLAGFSLGLLLDSMTIEGPSQLPALIILGFWWGKLSNKKLLVQKSLNLGLLAWIGTFFVGITLWIQQLSIAETSNFSSISAFHTILAQSLITSLLAPMVCSWIIIWFFNLKNL